MMGDVSRPDADASLVIESEMSALLRDGHSRVDATMIMIERITAEAREATTVVLVEGVSDLIALEVVAGRQGRSLRAEGTFVVPTGGATNFSRALVGFGPRGRNVRVAGLYDSPVETRIRRSLAVAGIGEDGGHEPLESYGFFSCVTDLEDEMIRALGRRSVEAIIAAEGELASLRRLQRMPFHRERPITDQLHRFISSRAGRKYRYARSFATSLDLDALPRPLARLLAHL